MGRLDGRSAFVTGAGSGIGLAVSFALLREGARVVATSIGAPGLGDAFAALQAAGAHTRVLDVSDEAAVDEAVGEAVSLFGPLDILSNNAGVELVHSPPLEATTSEEWNYVLEVNLGGTFRVCRSAIPHMAEGGSIVNMGSTKSFVGRENAAAYVSSKSALLGLTRALALELGHRQIRVNLVCPGTIDTPLTQAFLDDTEDPSTLLDRYASKAALKRVGNPAEVAACVVFLASEEASFVTGSALVVDGGALAS